MRVSSRRQISGESIGMAVLPVVVPELVCCPMLDNDGTGRPNLPKSSCESRQNNPKMRQCYGRCRGKRPEETTNMGRRITQQTGPRPNSAKTRFMQMLADEEATPMTYAEASKKFGVGEASLRNYYRLYRDEHGPSPRLINTREVA